MNIEPKIIKTDEEYRIYLAEVERLASEDPSLGSAEGNRLELLAKLVEDYELERFQFAKPDPIEAIRFRMKEQGLKQKDLIPMLGGKNRVSEVLNGKRPLTIGMVRELNKALRIPVELLISEPELISEDSDEKGDLFSNTIYKSRRIREPDFLDSNNLHWKNLKPEFGPLYLKRTITYGATRKTDKTNLQRWVTKVREIAATMDLKKGNWKPGTVSNEFLNYVAKLSAEIDGPIQAKEYLAESGIILIILPAYPRTELDGAAMLAEDGSPIIGMTIRHDRLDNFWFTLLHELVHVWKHLPESDLAITDENIDNQADEDENEAEANRIARDSFIPRSQWKRSEAFLRPSAESIIAFAQKLHIHPAIVAGRLRREKTGYKAYSKLVGYNQVSPYFANIKR